MAPIAIFFSMCAAQVLFALDLFNFMQLEKSLLFMVLSASLGVATCLTGYIFIGSVLSTFALKKRADALTPPRVRHIHLDRL